MNFKKLKYLIIILIILISGIEAAAKNNSSKADLRRISDKIKFENALLFYKIKKYDQALRSFNEYLEIFINGYYRKETYNYIAEIYFQNFDYQNTIDTYQQLFEEFSNTAEGVQALYKTGLCYQKMGYSRKARKVFKTIINDYPDSNFAYKANIQLNLLKILENKKNKTPQ